MFKTAGKSWFKRLDALVLAFLFLFLGQVSGANLSGVVRDPARAAVPDAKITAIHSSSGVETMVSTGASGLYRFPDLPSGVYRLKVLATGFQSATRDVDLRGNAPVVVDVLLAIQPALTSVDVRAQLSEAELDASSAAKIRESDVAKLLDSSGYASQTGGGLSALPVLRGLGDDRVNILLNGMTIGQACGNHMNPPLSYAAPASSGIPTVLPGVTPVSLGGDSTGGTIAVETAPPAFLADGRRASVHGGLSLLHRNNGVVNGGNAWFSLATAEVSMAYAGSYVNANNYKDGAGRMVKSTFYEAQKHDLQLMARRGANQFRADIGYQRIPQQGFVNARMDMTRNEAKYINGGYSRVLGGARLDGKLYYQDTRHEMNILRDKVPGMNMPMETRGVNVGYSLAVEKTFTNGQTVRAGQEMRRFSLDDWWPPVMMMVGSMGPDTLWNVRDGRRNRTAVFGEWSARVSQGWTTLLGTRLESVGMNAGDVVGYNTSLTVAGSAMYAQDAVEFNAVDRARRDWNVDFTAMARYEPRRGRMFELGFARKVRSPGIYERYLWVKRSMMSANMNGWFGDGNAYTGNLNLVPEAAHNFTAAMELRGTGEDTWKLRVSPFLNEVSNFIDVRRCPVINDRNNSCTAARLTAVAGFTTLQFFNYGARLAGVDGHWRVPVMRGNRGAGSLALAGVFSYVHGENRDTGQYLYNIMPVNGRVWLEHRRRNWSSTFAFHAVDAKRNVQATRNELATPGYAVMNVRTSYRWTVFEPFGLRLDAGIDNLGNRFYALPLGGRYWIGDMTGRTQVPGMGRNVWTGLTVEF